jgi:FCP1-like phosphatase family protein
MLTKLRPFVYTFLEEASNMFEMYIYTMGDRVYADEIAGLLDPAGVYFPTRVICRYDNTIWNQKGLDIVLRPENMVIILDDTENVSSNNHFILLFCLEKKNCCSYDALSHYTPSAWHTLFL